MFPWRITYNATKQSISEGGYKRINEGGHKQWRHKQWRHKQERHKQGRGDNDIVATRELVGFNKGPGFNGEALHFFFEVLTGLPYVLFHLPQLFQPSPVGVRSSGIDGSKR